ncbi:hypothetical protein [Bradyrhizobium erythrophlei]|uniref:Uncharacterized protein n=1 Tax=Bradyrhizobium erythrophlei TaxID=1437360 RepID=A0A1M5PNY4_9BRAD|nr:hypothetical protein [Bradyrhizobium erythrophlei]SHH03420.1 hypothetical protein SAMN05443248_3447 [Bradyrhizobium erythrophlei]
MSDVVKAEPRNSQEWLGQYLDEEGVVADVLKRVQADAEGMKRWLDPVSWHLPLLKMGGGRIDPDAPGHAGCLMFAGMSIRNFYGMWHASNPHTAKDDGDNLVIEDGIITDPRHPDNFSARVIERVKSTLADLVPA